MNINETDLLDASSAIPALVEKVCLTLGIDENTSALLRRTLLNVVNPRSNWVDDDVLYARGLWPNTQ